MKKYEIVVILSRCPELSNNMKTLRKEDLLIFLPVRSLPPRIFCIILGFSTSVLCDFLGLIGKSTDGRVLNSVEVAAHRGRIRH